MEANRIVYYFACGLGESAGGKAKVGTVTAGTVTAGTVTDGTVVEGARLVIESKALSNNCATKSKMIVHSSICPVRASLKSLDRWPHIS
jgi:hypothetical protein